MTGKERSDLLRTLKEARQALERAGQFYDYSGEPRGFHAPIHPLDLARLADAARRLL